LHKVNVGSTIVGIIVVGTVMIASCIVQRVYVEYQCALSIILVERLLDFGELGVLLIVLLKTFDCEIDLVA
jgi:hypothetical protein